MSNFRTMLLCPVCGGVIPLCGKNAGPTTPHLCPSLEDLTPEDRAIRLFELADSSRSVWR